MRVVYSNAESFRGGDMVRAVGTCRACRQKNVVWIVKGMIITFSELGCEFCGSGDVNAEKALKRAGKKVKKVAASDKGVEWKGLGCWGGKVVAQNFPEKARPGDIVV